MSNFSRMDFTTLPDVFFYELSCHFLFMELSETDTSLQRIPFPVAVALNGSLEAGHQMSVSMDLPDDWWRFISNYIPVKTGITRYALERPLEFRMLIGDRYLYDYRRSFSGYENMIHTGQSTSNIQGGFGLFTAYDQRILFNLPRQADFYDKLAANALTKDLNFINYPWEWRQ